MQNILTHSKKPASKQTTICKKNRKEKSIYDLTRNRSNCSFVAQKKVYCFPATSPLTLHTQNESRFLWTEKSKKRVFSEDVSMTLDLMCGWRDIQKSFSWRICQRELCCIKRSINHSKARRSTSATASTLEEIFFMAILSPFCVQCIYLHIRE